MKANYTKRIAEQTDRIRRIAATLPLGQRHTLLNACGTIELHTRRQSYLPTPSQQQEANRPCRSSAAAPTPSQQQEAISDRYNSTRAIVSALIAGRALSFRDAAEFHTSEFHTRIVEARHTIEDRYPEYAFRSTWADDGRYKIYWLETL